jgi:Tol biopolymer transport system component
MPVAWQGRGNPGASRRTKPLVSWSPDGSRVAYIERHKAVAHSRLGDQSWLLTRDVNGGASSQLILRDRRISPTNLCWARDGRLLYAMRADPRNPRGDYGAEAVRINGNTGQAAGAPEPVSNGLGWIAGLSVTSDGKRLLLWRGNALPQVFVSEFDRGATRLSTPRRLTLDENANEPALWTADSKSLLFLSDRGGAWKLFRQGLEQRIAEVAVESQNIQATLPRLSADGSEILFADVGGTEDPSAPVHVMAAPLAGGLPGWCCRTLESTVSFAPGNRG